MKGGGGGRGRGNFFIILRYLNQLLLNKPCAILYLLKDRVANPTPLNKFFKNIKTKKFFLGWGGGRANFVQSLEQFQNIRYNFSPAKYVLFCTYSKKG